MNRQNFSKPTQREIFKRASIDGVPVCEWTETGPFGLLVRCACTKGLEIHHDSKQDALKSDEDKAKIKLTADDGKLLCEPHHKIISKIQAADLAKAIRVEDRHLGIEGPNKQPIASRGFAKVSKGKRPEMRVANGLGPELARRGFIPASERNE